MSSRRLLTGIVLGLCWGALVGGCPRQGDPNDPNDPNGGGGGGDDVARRSPAECAADPAPTGEILAPGEGRRVFTAEARFAWQVADPRGDRVRGTVFVSRTPGVFAAPLLTQSAVTQDELFGQLTLALPEDGEYFWGVELFDGCFMVRRPADGVGVPFTASSDPQVRQETRLIPLCPGSGQTAREQTSFAWVPPEVTPVRTRIFVSRADQNNPFESALRVFNVDPPDNAFRRLSAGEALPVGSYRWGLRIETADEVFFAPSGSSGIPFTVAPNVPPTGRLLDPPNDTVLPDNSGPFLLRWIAEAGNCEETTTGRVFLEQLGDRTEPVNLFGSTRFFDAPPGALELNLIAALAGGDLPGGRWAWGVQVTDGTDTVRLPAEQGSPRTFRTFIRNPGPRFTKGPLTERRVCTPNSRPAQALVFGFEDGNGGGTVNVRLVFGTAAGTLFSNPTAELRLPAGSLGSEFADILAVVHAVPGGGCREFLRGRGLYGVELDDGVNPPVRASVSIDFTDCNTNGTPDDLDVLYGNSPDCNRNGVPDSCDIASGTSRDFNRNAVPDECENFIQIGATTQRVLQVDQSTGRASPISGTGLRGVSDVEGVALDTGTQTWFLADTDELYTFDPATSQVRVVGGLSPGVQRNIRALGFDTNARVLYGLADQDFVRIDPATARAEIVARLPRAAADLTFHAPTNQFFALFAAQGTTGLIGIDVSQSPPVVEGRGDFGDNQLNGLATDQRNGDLYASFIQNNVAQLFRVTFGDPNNPVLQLISESNQIPGTGSDAEFDPAAGAVRIACAPGGQTDVRLLRRWVVGAPPDRADFVLTGAVANGLAFATGRNMLLGLDRRAEAVLELDTVTGQARRRAHVFGFNQIGTIGLIHDPNSDRLGTLANFRSGNVFALINPDSGAVTSIATANLPGTPFALAYDAARQLVYCITQSTQPELRSAPLVLDPNAGPLAFQLVGTSVFVDALVFHPASQRLFALRNGAILDVDPATGSASTLTPNFPMSTTGLAHDPATGRFWAVAESLYELQLPGGGGIRAVGTVWNRLHALTADWGGAVLYGVGTSRGSESFELLRVDPQTGQGQYIAPLNINDVGALAFDNNAGILYLTEPGAPQARLLEVGTTTGALTPVTIPGGMPSAVAADIDPATRTLFVSTGTEFQVRQWAIASQAGFAPAFATPGLSAQALGYRTSGPPQHLFATGVRDCQSDPNCPFGLLYDVSSAGVQAIGNTGYRNVLALTPSPR